MGINRAHSDDMADLEAATKEAEAATAESSSDAQASKGQAETEREELASARREAARQNSYMEAKRHQVNEEMKRIDLEMQRLKSEGTALQRDLKRQTALLAAAEKEAAKRQEKLDKVRGETLAFRQLREETAARIVQMQTQMKDTNAKLEVANQEFAKTKADFDRTKIEQKNAFARLEQVKNETTAKKYQLESQLKIMKDQFRFSRERTAAMEEEIRQAKLKIQKLGEETKAAQGEISQADAKMADAQNRLNEVRGVKASEPKLTENDSPNEGELKEATLSTADGTPTRRTASSADGRVTLSRECRVFEMPNGKSKVLGRLKAGASVPGAAVNANWVSITARDKRTGYIAKGCL
jgi:chromosome segregation ATPase